jgi:CDP-glycerol glycerophosphotransferase (TagB/SpsB family)
MDVFYIGSELKTHFSAISLTLEELKKQGHNVTVRQWHYDNEEEERQKVTEIADVYLTEASLPKEIPEGSYWIEFRHGISPYKMNMGSNTHAKLVPTLYWKNVFDKNKNNITNKTFCFPTSGWSKIDFYYEKLQRREEIREEVYNKYHFDKDKKLVVYAPTGIRHETTTKKSWIEKYTNLEGYKHHGSYYHKETIQNIVTKIANLFEIPHPCINRDMEPEDRLDLLVASDLLISDISSIAMEYTALDKPIILLKKNIEDQDPFDFRICELIDSPIIDLGDIISIEELEKVLPYRLEVDDYKTIRNNWKDLLLGRVDGQCAKREADAIISICKSMGIIK